MAAESTGAPRVRDGCPHTSLRATVAAGRAAAGEELFCPACRTWTGAPALPPPRAPNVYRAPADDPLAEPVERAPRVRPTAEDRELARVRMLMSELRPDYAEPLKAPPKAPTLVPVVRVRDPQAGWGDVPAALDETGAVATLSADALAARAAATLARIARLDESARAVCGWLRDSPKSALVDDKGAVRLRGLYVEAGRAFASDDDRARWADDLTARRDGEAAQGRTLVLKACEAWEASAPCA